MQVSVKKLFYVLEENRTTDIITAASSVKEERYGPFDTPDDARAKLSELTDSCRARSGYNIPDNGISKRQDFSESLVIGTISYSENWTVELDIKFSIISELQE